MNKFTDLIRHMFGPLSTIGPSCWIVEISKVYAAKGRYCGTPFELLLTALH